MRCGIVGMKTRSVAADPGKMPTIAHVAMEIVHRLPPAEDGFEKVSLTRLATHHAGDRRPVGREGAMAPPAIGATPRRVVGVVVRDAFFP